MSLCLCQNENLKDGWRAVLFNCYDGSFRCDGVDHSFRCPIFQLPSGAFALQEYWSLCHDLIVSKLSMAPQPWGSWRQYYGDSGVNKAGFLSFHAVVFFFIAIRCNQMYSSFSTPLNWFFCIRVKTTTIHQVLRREIVPKNEVFNSTELIFHSVVISLLIWFTLSCESSLFPTTINCI